MKSPPPGPTTLLMPPQYRARRSTPHEWQPLPRDLSAVQTTTPAQRAALLGAVLLCLLLCVEWSFQRAAHLLNEVALLFYAAVLVHRATTLAAGLIYARWSEKPLSLRSKGARRSRAAVRRTEKRSPGLLPERKLDPSVGPAHAHSKANRRFQKRARARALPTDGRDSGDYVPVISVMVPLYKEAAVLAQIAGALGRMEYPPDRYEVMLLLEEDDHETRDAFDRTPMPSNFRAVVVPPGKPRTKPRACNYGVQQCRGDLVVIYDAEDLPEPDQFQRATRAFEFAHPRVACVQARLAFYNPRQNVLTRWFATEYLSWFGIMLPGLHAMGSPIPLGGTSNFFRVEALRASGGWDSWNVAEDCDLGIRLYRQGWRVELIDSTTWEEACPEVGFWIRQRSRWVKGYLQTWLVHTRHPVQLWRELGSWKFLNMQLVVGGSVLCLLLNPVYWFCTLLWWLHPTRWEEAMMGGPALVMGNISFVLGNTLFIAFHCAGALRRRHWDLALLGLFVPLYWLLMSVAAWKALLQLLWAPHYWEKTRHGLVHMPYATPLAEGGD